MFKLQFLLAWRNIIKRRFYSLIEMIGLAVGIACFYIILVHVNKEFSFDTCFTDYKKIYRILNLEKGSGNRYSGGASAIGFHAREEIPQVEEVVRVFFPYRMFSTSALVRYKDITFYEDNIIEADSNFFRFFDFEFIEGNSLSALHHPNSIVLSQHAAAKFFGDGPAVGKLINIDSDEALVVSAVVHVPDNTHLNFDFLRPAHHHSAQLYVWNHTLAFTYLKIQNKNDVPLVEKQLYDIVLKHSTNHEAEYLKSYFHQLQPFADVHTTVIQWDIIQPTSAKQLWSILIIAVFILLLAVFNFINLATARATERIKETGISKILGAPQQRLVFQFFTEFLIITLIAGAFTLILLAGFIELFNTSMSTSLAPGDFGKTNVVLIFFAVLLVTALTAGLYPAYRMAIFKPTQVIKRTFTAGGDQQRLRQVLVVFQFIISIGLLSGTLIVQSQIKFMQEADLGFDKNHIFILRLREPDRERFEKLKHGVMAHSQIVKVGGASALLGGEPGSDTFHPDHMPEPTPETFAKNIAVDSEFLELLGVPLLVGRNFQTDNPQDYGTAYIVNETTVKQFQLNDPININFRRSGHSEGKVIGVMKDFHFAKMNERISPMVFFMDSVRSYRYMFIRMQGDVTTAVKAVENAWASVMPEFPIEGFFQDQYFDSLYKKEQQVAKITQWFSILAIMLASLGLLGMSSFVVLQRTKEIGIRKIVGASVSDILILLSGNFFKLIAIAFVISVPITIYLLEQWLDEFVARISIQAYFFVMAGFITVSMALITIGYQAVKAALANPVKALKQE